MNDTLKAFGQVLAGIAVIGGLIFSPVIVNSIFEGNTPQSEVEAASTVQEPSCDEEFIAYERIEEETEELDEGDSEVTQAGVEGIKEICTNPETGEIVNQEIIRQPVNEITAIGTYVEPEYSYRIGAICYDGSRSYATGSGACSWHGGVYEWLYN